MPLWGTKWLRPSLSGPAGLADGLAPKELALRGFSPATRPGTEESPLIGSPAPRRIRRGLGEADTNKRVRPEFPLYGGPRLRGSREAAPARGADRRRDEREGRGGGERLRRAEVIDHDAAARRAECKARRVGGGDPARRLRRGAHRRDVVDQPEEERRQ